MEPNLLEQAEFADNPEPRCPVMLVLAEPVRSRVTPSFTSAANPTTGTGPSSFISRLIVKPFLAARASSARKVIVRVWPSRVLT